MKFTAAAIQMLASDDKTANLAEAARWIRQSAAAGAKLVALPEVFIWRGDKKNERAAAESIPGSASTGWQSSRTSLASICWRIHIGRNSRQRKSF